MNLDAENTTALIERARAGERDALEALMRRYLPRLQHWAHGRLPMWARDLIDTNDIVQDTLLRTMGRIEKFEPEWDGAFQAYLREAVLNRIRDELRRAGRRPGHEPLDSGQVDAELSPLERAMGREMIERYERALAALRADEREAIIARMELGCSYDEVALAVGKPTADAARKAVGRAIVRLVEAMGDPSGR